MEILRRLLDSSQSDFKKLTLSEGSVRSINGDVLKPYSALVQSGARVLNINSSISGYQFAELPDVNYYIARSDNEDEFDLKPNVSYVNPNKKIQTTFLAPSIIMNQWDLSNEAYFRELLFKSLSYGIDDCGLNGDGIIKPKGVFNTDGVRLVELGDDGASLTSADIDDLESYSVDNCLMEEYVSFITTSKVRNKLKNTPVPSLNVPVWNRNSNLLLGHEARASKAVVSDGEKGNGSNLHSLVVGDFSELFIVISEVSLIVDPYSYGTIGQSVVHANVVADFFVRKPSAFSIVKDIIV